MKNKELEIVMAVLKNDKVLWNEIRNEVLKEEARTKKIENEKTMIICEELHRKENKEKARISGLYRVLT